MERLDEEEVARGAGTTAGVLREWVAGGLIPQFDGVWTPEAAAHARLVALLRERGHGEGEIREAAKAGRLAIAGIGHLLDPSGRDVSLEEAARETGLELELITEALTAMGFGLRGEIALREGDLALLRDIDRALRAGLPRVAVLQLLRVYGQALAQVADAEVRLFHLYVHEPLMRDGTPGGEIAAQMEGLVERTLPLATPIMRRVHDHFLRHFVVRDVVGHMEDDTPQDGAAPRAPGHLRVAIAFADLAGYTRMTEELGDDEAVAVVEGFIEEVERSLPESARVVKTIGDEVMVVGADVVALTAWAVAFQAGRQGRRPLSRIGLHVGDVIYRDGDFYGREVNLASRVAARAAGGEVLVTRAVDEAAQDGLACERIGEVRLKGFADATELFLAYPRR